MNYRLWCNQYHQGIKIFGAHFNQARIPLVAAGLTFITQLALVPLLTLVLYISTFSAQIDVFTDAFIDYLHQTIIPEGADLIFEQINVFRHQALNLKTVGFITLFIISLLFIRTIDHTFNQILNIHHSRQLWKQLLIYWGFLLALPMLIGGRVLVREQLENSLLIHDYPLLTKALQNTIVLLFNTLFLWLFYRFVPAAPVGSMPAFVSALVIVIIIRSIYHIFLKYMALIGGYSTIYGSSAIIFVFLLWLNLLWMSLLSGAVLIRILSDK